MTQVNKTTGTSDDNLSWFLETYGHFAVCQ